MAALTLTVPVSTATTVTPTNLTISDAGLTPAGNATTATAVAMSATQIKTIFVSPKRADPLTGLVTLTASAFTGVTYELYPA
jgi:hypothetical protein